MADFLLELFLEEIPARMQADALAYLQNTLKSALKTDSKGFVTPRRVAVIINDLPAVQPDISLELKGPKIDAPEAALQGFLKKNNLTIEQLEKRDGVYFANIHQKGKATAELLKELIEKTLAEFPWPKSMRWGSGNTSWVRPLHSILCIFDGKVIPVEFAGVKAGNTTRGHRFLAPGEIIISNPAEYEPALEKAFVIADRDKRKAEIVKQANAAAASKGMTLKDDAGLLEEVTGLVEWPNVLVGSIDAAYRDLPGEVIVSEMRGHQKYFALVTKDGTFATDSFLITSNMKTDDAGKAIIAGNERVLKARLADGRFFWDQDRKKPLEEWAKGLAAVTYHAKLGSVADKVSRIKALADIIAQTIGADKKLVARAAELSKADLVTGMVGEFPELQGVMGWYYANAHTEDKAVAEAIRDHYKPQGPSDSVPTAPVSVCVALADKLDTLISMFAIGEKPTGSKDPFALRRAALGVIRIVLENNVRLPLKSLFANAPLKDIALHKAHDKLAKQTEERLQEPHKVGKYLAINETACEDIPEDAKDKLAASLLEFFHDRLKVQLKDSGIRHDVINAVMSGDDDLVRITSRAKALQDFLNTEDGKNLLAAYKRAANILVIEEKKDKQTYLANALKAELLKEKEETALAALLAEKAPEISKLKDLEKYEEAMRLLATLRAPVDHFFEKIMVNADDKTLREQRLRLLARIRESVDSIADFAKIEG